jgi:hypothetical protein
LFVDRLVLMTFHGVVLLLAGYQADEARTVRTYRAIVDGCVLFFPLSSFRGPMRLVVVGSISLVAVALVHATLCISSVSSGTGRTRGRASAAEKAYERNIY